MKIISFSAVEILSALLDKSKTQTIRPVPKKPRFKVGERVKMVWKQRCPQKWFCFKCGKMLDEVKEVKGLGSNIIKFCPEHGVGTQHHKILGEGIITEVFEITMQTVRAEDDPNTQGQDGYVLQMKYPDGRDLLGEDEDDIAERDGFSDGMQFHDWFNKQYDLSKPSKLVVYRWRWL